jgi:hypothetical protein
MPFVLIFGLFILWLLLIPFIIFYFFSIWACRRIQQKQIKDKEERSALIFSISVPYITGIAWWLLNYLQHIGVY